ncbi:MAG: hypothetical protein M3461_07050 [Pseudomonadota bacterium]|nr:hypothetical protein [Pseudomonadota bacterium]
MDEIGMLIPVLVALIGLYGLYWARKEEVVQPEGGAQYLRADQGGVVAGDEAAATGDEATEIEPPGIEDGAIPLNLEKAPEGVS